MRTPTRQKFSALKDQIAHLNGISDASEKFTVEPSVQQRLETNMQESSDFLSQINMVGVSEQMGERLGLGVSGPIAGRTNTDEKERATRDVTTLDENGYLCVQTNFDTHIRYQQLDAWAKFPDFQTRVRDIILKRQALDRIAIGWNGVRADKTTDLVANPLLQDVNIGWLQKYREHAPKRVMSSGKEAGKITIGVGGDYANIDALVMDAVNELIDPWYQEDPDLVVLVGRKLLHDKYFPLIQKYDQPTESRALDMMVSQRRIGGLQANKVPFMLDKGIFITSLSNLSLYWQEGSRRRVVVDNAKRDRIENFESSNDAYVVEDYGFGCLIENIEVIA
ncbi:phage major capsid protein, P2 family [Zymobacter palmae]|uniref:DNA polymerase III, alpha subunit n=1 Tax=Zymobacter palmae TaxID=33074 RepID=A0A348HI63_9GAMM|nr:phage major capsid protein, P2 family [Zymobacter palmae]BBG31315.1 DNA polymerase III, alpha subunit [Zymobacter palmae]